MSIEKEFRAHLGYKDEKKYHYCSLEALYGIISSRSIWLTSLESTNDKKELHYGQKILDCALQELIQSEKNADTRKILEKVVASPTGDEFKKYRNKTKYHYYGASFVENKDSLIHWERYGNNGYGVCIAFNTWMIQNFFQYWALPYICDTWLWHKKIIYKENYQKEYSKYLVLSMIKEFSSKGADVYNTPNVCSTIYYSVLDRAKPIFKHAGFLEENEYRLVFIEGQAEGMADYFNEIASKTDSKELFLNISKYITEAIRSLNLNQENKCHRIIGNSIRSYFSMNLDRMWGEALIPEILLGPRCYQNKRELISFLKSNELNGTRVLISEIPMR